MEKLEKIKKLAYKNRFSLYYNKNYCLIRVYYKGGGQHKEIGVDLEEAIDKMINFLEINK